MSPAIVLMVGRDRLLLETRSQILRGAYTVVSSSSPKQAIDKFLAGNSDFILLCHSIPADDRARLAHLIRQHTQRTPLVSVSSFDGEYDSFVDAVIENDPALLTSGLREMLNSNHSRNK